MNATPRTTGLASFQDAFARALLAPDAEPDAVVAALAAQPAFAVYRNTVMKGCVDALEANFPSVARLAGREWFRAVARTYASLALPSGASLLRYGASFPAFLEAFEPAAELPYLPGVAKLDRLWTEAHESADGIAVGLDAFAALGPEGLAAARLVPHAAARWAWFEEAPIYSIWKRNREQSDDESQIAWVAEGALVTRPEGFVRWTALGPAGRRFLDACARGETVEGALDAALESDPDADLIALVTTLVEAGAFGRLIPAAEDAAERSPP